MKTTVIGLVAGPGAGKSTLAAGVFADLKNLGINCELASEWVKEAAWEGRDAVTQCQPYVWGQQLWRIQRLLGKVDVVITDSPPVLGVLYARPGDYSLVRAMWDAHLGMDADNVLVRVVRTKPYVTAGRWQDEETAMDFDRNAKAIPCEWQVTGDTQGRNVLVSMILARLGR